MELDPEPPTIEVGLLGSLVERSFVRAARPTDPIVLMRSTMIVESGASSRSCSSRI